MKNVCCNLQGDPRIVYPFVSSIIDFSLKFDFVYSCAQVNNAAHERCLDPIPLEAPILDKLISAKMAKNRDHSAIPL